MAKNQSVFKIDLKKNLSWNNMEKLLNPMNSIGDMMFHLLKDNIIEKTTGYATKSKKWKIYGDTNMYGRALSLFMLFNSLISSFQKK